MILDFFTEIIFYNAGYFFLKGITFGRFPKRYDKNHDDPITILVGAIVVVVMGTIGAYLFL